MQKGSTVRVHPSDPEESTRLGANGSKASARHIRRVFAKRRANQAKHLRRTGLQRNGPKMPFVGRVLAGILRPLFNGFVAKLVGLLPRWGAPNGCVRTIVCADYVLFPARPLCSWFARCPAENATVRKRRKRARMRIKSERRVRSSAHTTTLQQNVGARSVPITLAHGVYRI